VATTEPSVIQRFSDSRSSTLPATILLQEFAKSDRLSLLPTRISTVLQRKERALSLAAVWKQRDLHVLTFFHSKISQGGVAFNYSGLTAVVFPFSAQSRLPMISYLLGNFPSTTINIS